MQEKFTISPIAHIYNDFKEKFGVPRQSGLVPDAVSTVVFEQNFQNPDFIRGIEGFSRLWLIWGFSQAHYDGKSATARPPKLGGNTNIGIFATRSPFRPNSLGLSCVKLIKVNENGSLEVSGADLMNGTPIFDIKPYLPYADSYPEALGGFALQEKEGALSVFCPEELKAKLTEQQFLALKQALSHDPRPSYQDDGRIYKMSYAEFQVEFTVKDGTAQILNIY